MAALTALLALGPVMPALADRDEVVWYQRDTPDPTDPSVSYAQTQSDRGEIPLFCELEFRKGSPVRRIGIAFSTPGPAGSYNPLFGRESDYPLCASGAGFGGQVWAAVVWREGVFYTDDGRGTGRAAAAQRFGDPGGRPLMGDWNGDLTDSAGVYADGVFSLTDVGPGGARPTVDHVVRMGRPGDFAVAGDWDGDGVDSPGVVRGNTWFLSNGFDGHVDVKLRFGRADDYPLVARNGYSRYQVDAPVALRCVPSLSATEGCLDLRRQLDPLGR